MGMPLEAQPGIDDHSRTVNVGLVNVESKEETTNNSEFSFNLHWKTFVEIAVGVLIILYLARRLVRYIKNKKEKSKKKKSMKLKEIVQDAHRPSAPTENPYSNTFPVAVSTIKNNSSFPNRDIALKVLQEPMNSQIVPIFSSNLYD